MRGPSRAPPSLSPILIAVKRIPPTNRPSSVGAQGKRLDGGNALAHPVGAAGEAAGPEGLGRELRQNGRIASIFVADFKC